MDTNIINLNTCASILVHATSRQNTTSKFECEFRFGQFSENGQLYIPGLEWKRFDRLKRHYDELAKKTDVILVESNTTDYSQGLIRATLDDDTGEVIWIEKHILHKETGSISKDYPIRLAMSLETPIPTLQQPNFAKFEARSIRTKKRSSYTLKSAASSLRLDLTVVKSYIRNEDDPNEEGNWKTTYECEIEILNFGIALRPGPGQFQATNILNLTLFQVLKIANNTEVLYTQSEKERIISFVNTTLSRRGFKPNVIDRFPLSEARNLKFRDCIGGGLIANQNQAYTVTHKADGLRKLLVVHSTGIWLVSPPNDCMLVMRDVKPYSIVQGAILDGELVTGDAQIRTTDTPPAKLWYFVFDCLGRPSTNGSSDTDVQTRVHQDRMIEAQSVANYFKDNPTLFVMTKQFTTVNTPQFPTGQFWEIKTADNFFATMQRFFVNVENSNVRFKTDGLIFTPAFSPYNIKVPDLALQDRKLSWYPDICKWKPREQLTIDFRIKWVDSDEGTYVDLFTYNTVIVEKTKKKLKEEVRFTGSAFNPFDATGGNHVKNNSKLLKDVQSGTVVEFMYNVDKLMFKPVKIRPDKQNPNPEEFCIDIWNDIHSPITQQVLMGQTTKFMQWYHNRIKRDLYVFDVKHPIVEHNEQEHSETEHSETGQTLLELGAGKGQTADSWKNYDKVVAVELLDKYIVELKDRIQSNHLEDKVMPLQASVLKDTAKIISAVTRHVKGRVTTIACMLSMSFFWQNSDTVNQFATLIASTLAPGGRLLFLTLDGDMLDQIYDPPVPIERSEGTELNEIRKTFKYIGRKDPKSGKELLTNLKDINKKDKDPKSGKELLTNLKDTVVKNQTEYFVYLDDLLVRLSQNLNKGFWLELPQIDHATSELFLTPNEKLITRFYSYGYFVFHVNDQQNFPTLPKLEIIKTPRQPPTDFPYPVTRTLSLDDLSITFNPPPFSSKVTIQTQARKQFRSLSRNAPAPAPVPTSTSATPLKKADDDTGEVSPDSDAPEGNPTEPSDVPETPEEEEKEKEKEFRTKFRMPTIQIRQAPTVKPVLPVMSSSPSRSSPSRSEPRPTSQTKYLPPLLVEHTPTDKAYGDDQIQNIRSRFWTVKPILRIAGIQDGNQLLHSILKAFYKPYSETLRYSTRVDIVRQVRRDLAALIYGEQTGEDNTILTEIADNLNSTEPIIMTDDLLTSVSQILKMDIYWITASEANDDIDVFKRISERDLDNPEDTEDTRKSVVILGDDVGTYFELVGIDLGKEIQTVFLPEDQFIDFLKTLSG